MWEQSYPYFLWIEKTGLGHSIRQSKWTFAITEVLHLLGLTLLLGTVLIMALRLFGFVLRTKAVAEIARELRPWSLGGLTLVVLTGLLLFVSEATKCWGNIAFRYKMLFLFLALLFQFTALQRVSRADQYRFSPLAQKTTALVSVLLWFGVATAGRAIAFF